MCAMLLFRLEAMCVPIENSCHLLSSCIQSLQGVHKQKITLAFLSGGLAKVNFFRGHPEVLDLNPGPTLVTATAFYNRDERGREPINEQPWCLSVDTEWL